MQGVAMWVPVVLSLIVVVLTLGVSIYLVRSVRGNQLDEAHSQTDIERNEIRRLQEALDEQRRSDEAQRTAFFADLAAEREDLRHRWTITEERLKAREEGLLAESKKLQSRSAQLQSQVAELEARRAELASEAEALDERIQAVASLSALEARELVLAQAEKTAQADAIQLARQIESEATRKAEAHARRIIVTCLQRVAADQTAESVVSTVPLPSEDMKGRIIGREGRNIRSFEQITGVNVLVDDTPETVVLSSFDPVRREIARLTLNELVEDGRIHPARIEEVHRKCASEIDDLCWRAAEDACAEVGITDLHPELMTLLGSLKYRTSYGQNVLSHLVEASHLAGLMAAEIGVDAATCKRATFLHDIGKALTHEQAGSHAANGAEIAQKFGEDPDVVHAIAAHHNEVEPETVEAVLVQAADAMSGGRPGARRETLEAYVERLEKLEELASSHPGVERVFAMQAGREIRIMVSPDTVDDAQSHAIAKGIATKIEQQLTYPGTIRVTVVRESRATEVAR